MGPVMSMSRGVFHSDKTCIGPTSCGTKVLDKEEYLAYVILNNLK